MLFELLIIFTLVHKLIPEVPIIPAVGITPLPLHDFSIQVRHPLPKNMKPLSVILTSRTLSVTS
jgi:hypothetical protein